MRKILLPLAAAAGIAGAFAAPLAQPATAAVIVATPARPVWHPAPVVVVHPTGGYWYSGHRYYHRAWGTAGWRYW
jgi:hypothetical protein